MEAARWLGGEFEDRYRLPVAMQNYDIEVYLHIIEGDLVVGIQIPSSGSEYRGIAHIDRVKERPIDALVGPYREPPGNTLAGQGGPLRRAQREPMAHCGRSPSPHTCSRSAPR